MNSPLDDEARHAVRSRIEQVDRVRRVLVDEDEPVLWVVCDADADAVQIDAAAREALARVGVNRHALRVETLSRGTGGVRRRARFETVDRRDEPNGGVSVRVTLEWRGELFTGESTSEVGGGLVELRTGATAAIAALESLIGRSLELRLIGVKNIRAFDRDFMVVSLVRSGESTGHFVGSVLVSGDPLTAAVLAVLDAVNRMLGNYLATTD